eukprot:scaffold12121_cov192-Skeletonema_marinoi.AAC.1
MARNEVERGIWLCVVELSTVEEEAEEKLYKMRFDDLMLSAAGIFMMLRLMRAALQGSPITDKSLVYVQIGRGLSPSRGGLPQVVQGAMSQCRQGW